MRSKTPKPKLGERKVAYERSENKWDGISSQIELQEKLKVREKLGEEKNRRRKEGWSLHRVGGADGLPEDGVGPADLLAEPAQRVPHRHPGDAGREP